MICSDCHRDIDITDPKILQAYLWQTDDGHILFICPKCVCQMIVEHMAKKNIVIASPSIPVDSGIRHLEID